MSNLRACKWCGKATKSASGACSPEHAEKLGNRMTAVPVGTPYLTVSAGVKFENLGNGIPGGIRRGGRSNGTGGG